MTIARKEDAEQIRSFLAELASSSWLGAARSWWPQFVFRFDHLEAVARVLNCGRLLSRSRAASEGVLHHDAASPGVISKTQERWKDHVRLYFRPRTPTQFSNEGFRPPEDLPHGAHCPAPVVLLFDASDVLTRTETLFSAGNMASPSSTPGSTASYLADIPFKSVYHDTWFEPHQRDQIIFHRHAEVLVPGELDLAALRFVGCRTQAEYETLLHLLDSTALSNLRQKIGLGTKANLHCRKWTFVESVDLTPETSIVYFNPSTVSPGPFRARVEVVDPEKRKTYRWHEDAFNADTTLRLRFPSALDAYALRLFLNDDLAYANRYENELPF